MKLLLFVSILVFVGSVMASEDIFRDKNGEGVHTKDIVKCQFSPATPDGHIVFFAPTDRGNLAEVFGEGPNIGKTSIYKFVGESNTKIYRVYKTGSIMIAVHKSKPHAIMVFGDEQYSGSCDRQIPLIM